MSTKPCPIRPCPEQISIRWDMCEPHWALVPSYIRKGNRLAKKIGDVGAATFTAVLGLRFVWQFYEHAALPTLPNHRGGLSCECGACRAIQQRAQKTLNVSDEFWQHLKKSRRRDPTAT